MIEQVLKWSSNLQKNCIFFQGFRDGLEVHCDLDKLACYWNPDKWNLKVQTASGAKWKLSTRFTPTSYSRNLYYINKLVELITCVLVLLSHQRAISILSTWTNQCYNQPWRLLVGVPIDDQSWYTHKNHHMNVIPLSLQWVQV